MDPTTTEEPHLADCDQPEPGWYRHIHPHTHKPADRHRYLIQGNWGSFGDHPHYHWRHLNHLNHHHINPTEQQQHRDEHDEPSS